jgi:hypothetical protein
VAGGAGGGRMLCCWQVPGLRRLPEVAGRCGLRGWVSRSPPAALVSLCSHAFWQPSVTALVMVASWHPLCTTSCQNPVFCSCHR